MNIIANTDFSYLGDRDYINSTSLVEFIHDNIDVFIDSAPHIDYSLDIKIHKEVKTNCRVDVYKTNQEYNKESIICDAILRSNNDIRYVYFVSNDRPVIKNKIDPKYVVEKIELYGEFSGYYRISASNYSEFIRNVIQSNKLLHIDNLDFTKYKILNMFMKSTPVELIKYNEKLDIEIKNIGIRFSSDGSLSTMNKVIFTGISLKPMFIGFQVLRLHK